MAKSIMQTEKECYITHSTQGLHKHHIYGGYNRSKSEAYGCWIWLRNDWHVNTPYSIHNNTRLMKFIRTECQLKFEEIYGHDKFMQVFGRNYKEETKYD